MALVSALAVGIGGAAGAVCRYTVGELLEPRALDTLVVNVIGSLLLGLLLGASVANLTLLALGVGFCGAFTTFSSFAVSTIRFAEDGERRLAVVNAVGTLVLAVAGVLVGVELGALLA